MMNYKTGLVFNGGKYNKNSAQKKLFSRPILEKRKCHGLHGFTRIDTTIDDSYKKIFSLL